MAPHPGLPGMGPGGLLAFGGGLGAGAVPGAASAPLAAAAAAAAAAQQQHPLLKPADLHNPRDPSDIKGPSSLPEERLVSKMKKYKFVSQVSSLFLVWGFPTKIVCMFLFL